ncbi:PaaI family thioesterase [soil metagenome]
MSQFTGLGDLLGIEFAEVTPDRVVLSWTADERHLQPFGIVHGGVYCSMHETAASVAGQVWFGEKGGVVGVNNTTDFLGRTLLGEHMTSTAIPVHRGRTGQLWRVETRNADGKLVSVGQVRLQNLDTPPPPGTMEGIMSLVKG